MTDVLTGMNVTGNFLNDRDNEYVYNIFGMHISLL